MNSPRSSIQTTNINCVKCRYIILIKVLALGLYHTGTESLIEALQLLGYNKAYYGYQALITNPHDYEIWYRGLYIKYNRVRKPFSWVEFNQLLSNIPVIYFLKKLIEAYLEAKVILTVCNIDKYRSMIQLAEAVNTFTIKYIVVPIISTINNLTLSRFRWVIPMFEKAGQGKELLYKFLGFPVLLVLMPNINSKSKMRVCRQQGMKGTVIQDYCLFSNHAYSEW
ncbi:hypothetical protein BJX70DRAFT_392869 [Aspergillus crustosus]